jgi:hypothetical protein
MLTSGTELYSTVCTYTQYESPNQSVALTMYIHQSIHGSIKVSLRCDEPPDAPSQHCVAPLHAQFRGPLVVVSGEREEEEQKRESASRRVRQSLAEALAHWILYAVSLVWQDRAGGGMNRRRRAPDLMGRGHDRHDEHDSRDGHDGALSQGDQSSHHGLSPPLPASLPFPFLGYSLSSVVSLTPVRFELLPGSLAPQLRRFGPSLPAWSVPGAERGASGAAEEGN